MRLMLDAAQLPATIPQCDVLAGYITSPADAHTWTADEWARAKAHAHGFLPIHVAPGGSNAIAGAAAGHQSVNDARGLGVPDGCAVCIDIEANVAQAVVGNGYADAWVGVVGAAGFRPLTYASETSRALVQHLGDLWLAKWNGKAELLPGTVATQYINEHPAGFDSSVLADSLRIAPSTPGGNPVPAPNASPARFTVPTPSGNGYWQVTVDGHVYAFGDAEYLHGPDDPHVAHAPITCVSAHPTAQGYWITAADGGVFPYGAAKYHGNVIGGVVHKP